MEELSNNSEKIVKPIRNEKGQLLPGVILNPNGKAPGTKNFETDFDEAVDEIAKDNGITRSEARKILFKVAYKNAKDGNFSFYKDIHDRIYGTPVNRNEITGKDGKDFVNPKPDIDIQEIANRVGEELEKKWENTQSNS